MSQIHVLEKHVAELIAAGEVVERPASVVKEMVENALDAGASSVTIEIKNGGVSYIRISDNGSGIVKDDVATAFLRHATSKIQEESDLNAIATLGFRGEALASIAAVSRVEVITRTKEEDFGTRYCIEGGEEVVSEDTGCPVGTTFVIRDLFYNTPARMKFLKKDVAEGNAVADVIDRLALSHPEVSFRLLREGRQTLLTPGDGKLYSAIYAVYGREFASSLIPVDYTNGNIRITGYTVKPVAARKNRSMQLFFVNGRFVKTGTGSAALQEAYKNTVMVGKFPAGVYHLSFPYHEIDVNVHPAKIEVRFSNEKAIFSTVFYGVRSALDQGDTRPVMQLSKEDSAETAAPITPVLKKASAAFQTSISHRVKTTAPEPVQTKFHMVSPKNILPIENHDTLKDQGQEEVFLSESTPKVSSFTPSVSGNSLDVLVEEEQEPLKTENDSLPVQETLLDYPVRIIGEIFQTYILAEVDGKVLVIDKHAAHERILFDELKQSAGKQSAQMLLNPVMLTLRKHEYTLLLEHTELLEEAGILLEAFGEDAIAVRAVPMNLAEEDVRLLMEEIVEKLSGGFSSVTADKLDWLYHSIACRSAVKGGNHTSRAELEALAKRIAADDSVRYCPHGRPVAMWLTRQQFEKQFGRS